MGQRVLGFLVVQFAAKALKISYLILDALRVEGLINAVIIRRGTRAGWFTLGHNCHIRQFCKVSIELPNMAVLWTHFCVDRTAIYGSFMDTFRLSEP